MVCINLLTCFRDEVSSLKEDLIYLIQCSYGSAWNIKNLVSCQVSLHDPLITHYHTERLYIRLNKCYRLSFYCRNRKMIYIAGKHIFKEICRRCVKNSDLVMWKVKWNEFVSEFVLNYIGTNKESITCSDYIRYVVYEKWN